MSERLRGRLSGAQIDRQFDSIRQGGRIRTTPTPSPRSSRSLIYSVGEARSTTSARTAVSGLSASPSAGPAQGNEDLEDKSVTPTPESPFETSSQSTNKPKENRRTLAIRPPPILKKSSSGPNRPSRSPSISSPTSPDLSSAAATGNEGATAFVDDPTHTESLVSVGGKSTRKSTTTRFSEEVAVSIPKASTVARLSGARLSGEGSQRPGRRNPIVVASTGANKRRPPVMRQRSSQIAPFGASRDPPSRSSSSSTLALSMRPPDSENAKSPGREAEASSAGGVRAASSHPLRHHKGSFPSPLSREGAMEDFGGENAMAQEPSMNPDLETSLAEGRGNAHSEISKPLVDPDFRSQFVDKIHRSTRSFTNIPSIARKSSAVVPMAASFQASGMIDTGQGSSSAGRDRGKEAFINEIVPLKAPAPEGPEVSAETSQPLPRTKSQLTLLLEREKNRSAGQEH